MILPWWRKRWKRRFAHGMCERAQGEDARIVSLLTFLTCWLLTEEKDNCPLPCTYWSSLDWRIFQLRVWPSNRKKFFCLGKVTRLICQKNLKDRGYCSVSGTKHTVLPLPFIAACVTSGPLHSSLDDVPGIGPACWTLFKTFWICLCCNEFQPRK